jgi:hypothetical protein
MGYKTKSQGEHHSLSENILPMQESGQLNFIKRPGVTFWNSQN